MQQLKQDDIVEKPTNRFIEYKIAFGNLESVRKALYNSGYKWVTGESILSDGCYQLLLLHNNRTVSFCRNKTVYKEYPYDFIDLSIKEFFELMERQAEELITLGGVRYLKSDYENAIKSLKPV